LPHGVLFSDEALHGAYLSSTEARVSGFAGRRTIRATPVAQAATDAKPYSLARHASCASEGIARAACSGVRSHHG